MPLKAGPAPAGLLVLIERLRLLARLSSGRLRATILRVRGAHVGSKTTIGARFHVSRPWCLRLGERVVIEDDVYVKIEKDDALLQVGDFTFIGRRCEFDVVERIVLGDHVLVAPDVFITDHNHGTRLGSRINEQACPASDVEIGSGSWIGVKATVLPGVTVGSGSVIGAHSLVNSDVAGETIVVGTPARVIRKRI